MSPLRIVIIGVLLYIAYRLIFGGKTDKNTLNKKMGSGPEHPTEDVLEEDPVCHSLVPRQQAVTLKHHGSTVYFCCEKCRNTFIAQQGES